VSKAITKDGVSLIHLAVKNRHFECVPVLAEANADINSKLPDKLYFYFSLLIGNKLLN
jgi:ankyrin repeat protein